MASALKRISQYNAGMPAALHQLKWKALRESPFRFYRGTCHLFAADFVKLYKYKPKVKSWICGDLHFENFGSYKGENRIVYFDINDFDEGLLAGPEPEVARFLTSIIVIAAGMKVAPLTLHKALHDIMAAYTGTLLGSKALMMEQAVAKGVFKEYFERLNTLDREAFIHKHTYKQKGSLLLQADDTHYMHLEAAQKTQIYNGLGPLMRNSGFEHFVFEDAAFRIAGTGSLGLERYCVLCYNKKKGRHYMMDIKQARHSCYDGLVKTKQPAFRNEAERVRSIGYLMEFNTPAFTSSVKIKDKWFVVKEMQREEDRMNAVDFKDDFGSLTEAAMEMAVLMGYAQIRSSGHLGASTADELRKFAGKKQWQKDVIDLSGELARRNKKYYKEFCNAQ